MFQLCELAYKKVKISVKKILHKWKMMQTLFGFTYGSSKDLMMIEKTFIEVNLDSLPFQFL